MEHQNVKHQNLEALRNLESLRKWELVEINEKLHQSIEDLQKAREQITYTNRRLSEDNTALRQQYSDMRAINGRLHLAVRELGQENISLLEANQQLAGQNQHLTDRNQHLTQQLALCTSSMSSYPKEPRPSALKRLREWIHTKKV